MDKQNKTNVIKIPKQFELLGQTIEVVLDNDNLNNEELYAQACFRKNMIRFSNECITGGKRQKMPEDKLNVSFLHELVHFILQIGNLKVDDDNDEEFVHLFAELLYQYHKSAKY